jgi:hypothetical protein
MKSWMKSWEELGKNEEKNGDSMIFREIGKMEETESEKQQDI